MTLKEYAAEVAKFAEAYPKLLVVASSDDEGNSFNPVNFGPTLGHFANRDEFLSEQDAEEQGLPVNAVCIN